MGGLSTLPVAIDRDFIFGDVCQRADTPLHRSTNETTRARSLYAQPMRNGHAIAIVLSFICLTAPAQADFKAGVDAHHRSDYATALREWQPLAEQGNAFAQYNLGLLYDNGQGVPKDYDQARQWYEKAAVQGHAEAQVNLGILHDYGRSVPQDFKKALYWYRLSAKQGNDLAQRRLGFMYERGDGVAKDYVQAYMWYLLGATGGADRGAARKNALAKQMTPEQIAEAQKLAQEWKPKGK